MLYVNANGQIPKNRIRMCVCCVYEQEQRVMTHPWAAEGAGGQAR